MPSVGKVSPVEIGHSVGVMGRRDPACPWWVKDLMEIGHSVRASDMPSVGKVSHVEFRGVIGTRVAWKSFSCGHSVEVMGLRDPACSWCVECLKRGETSPAKGHQQHKGMISMASHEVLNTDDGTGCCPLRYCLSNFRLWTEHRRWVCCK